MTKDNNLDTFRQICDKIAEERSYNQKSKILQDFFRFGIEGNGFKGDFLLWVNMLLPAASHKVYNLQNKQLIKLFSRMFSANQQEMTLDLEQVGDISETIEKFFRKSTKIKPQQASLITLNEVDSHLNKLETKTKEDEQMETISDLIKLLTSSDLKMVIRIIKQDLRINAGPRHILDAFGPSAYKSYQSSRNLNEVVKSFSDIFKQKKFLAPTATKTSSIQIMTPISPMLAKPCNSIDDVFVKNRDGVYCEVKYDGERVQIHKKGNEFRFFSRNLKPVTDHKINRVKEYIPKAFPSGDEIILDSEIILVDTQTEELLPFGSLGKHKKEQYKAAEVCIFVFDCIFYNGKDLTSLSLTERRSLLEKNIKPIKSHVQLSKHDYLKTKNELALMTAKVLQANLEGVVLKAPSSTYQPGKRNWLKIKKDYLFGGKMADTADLVVLGGWYGSGRKGGLLSIFLMGCFDEKDRLWKTVTKVHSGLDDCTNDNIHNQLMDLTIRSDPNHLPSWLLCKKSLVPDFIAKDPKVMPVWEITGAEFTKSDAHTADGISIRFPRITRIRTDKSTADANNLQYLNQLYTASKDSVNVDMLMGPSTSAAAKKLNSKLRTPPKRNDDPPEKKPKIDCSPCEKEQEDFFQNFIGYFTSSKQSKIEMYKKLFESHGGKVTANSRKANLAFYEIETPDADLKTCRKNFNPRCRHLCVKWVEDSVTNKKLELYSLHAIHLISEENV